MHTHLLTALLVLSTTATTKKPAGGSSPAFIFLILIVVAVYFFFLRPRSRRARQQQQSKSNLQVGDEVVSAGGILGRITGISGDEIEVEVAPGTILTFWRRAVSLRSSVAGAPQPAADASPGPGHGIDDRYDDEAEPDGAPHEMDDDDGARYDVEDDDGARYGVQEVGGSSDGTGSSDAAAAAPVDDGAPPPPQPYLDPEQPPAGEER